MKWKVLKLALSIAVIGGSLALIFYRSASDSLEYYKHVDEVVPNSESWQDKTMQIHGFITPGSLERQWDAGRQQLKHRFVLTNCNASLPVVHEGTLPDGLRDGAEVVCHGKLTGGIFAATKIVTKCPSKYRSSATSTALCVGPREKGAATQR